MRWDSLFADLEAQLYAAARLELETEVNERLRMDHAAFTLTDRLRGQLRQAVRVRLAGNLSFTGTLAHVGASWIVLDESARSVLIALGSVQFIEGMGRTTVLDGPQGVRLGLASALRALARNRAEIVLFLAPGSEPHVVTGTIDRVGKDFFELAAVASGEARRAGNVQGVLAVPFEAVAAVASARRTEA
jgi:hypothetical protein